MITGLKQKLDYSDYAGIPPDRSRYEILDGDLYVTPAPSPRPQRISKRLLRQLEAYFEAGLKARRYAALGVRHYWVVDPEGSRLECYRVEGGAYTLVVQGEGNSSLSHPDWPGLTLALSDLWR